MTKTNTIKYIFQKEISKYFERVYYGNATDNAIKPYAVFKIRDTTIDYPTRYGNVEINVFFDNVDNVDIDEKIDSLDYALNRFNYIDHNINIFIYSGSRNVIENRTKDLMQIRILFDINYVFYGGE